MRLAALLSNLPTETDFAVSPRPYVNHSVQLKKPCTAKERTSILEAVGLNVFFFPSEMVTGCDLLSDSGTTAMTNEQWAAIHMGDEAYGSNKGYFLLLSQIGKTFGEKHAYSPTEKVPRVFIFHQGRSCEHALFRALAAYHHTSIIPSNGHFDTTQANIDANGLQPLNLFSSELTQENDRPFKGNMDIVRLQRLLRENGKRVGLIFLTITNNTGGGQPVSMENIKAVSALAQEHRIPFFFDACRFAENAWFIQQRETGYKKKTIPQIVEEMFSFVDGFTISFKKDGLANMGGAIILRKDGLWQKRYPGLSDSLMNHQITTEGHPTYGGLSGRDIMTIVYGLRTVVNPAYLSYRIGQVQQFGNLMKQSDLPTITPVGGHAVYLDMNRFFVGTNLRPGDFGGIGFTALLLAQYGHRACELGNFAFGAYNLKTRKETFPEVNFVRFAVPRLRYEMQDLLHVVESVKALYEHRHDIPPIDVTYGKDLPLRHFKARFRFAR